ncbi:hypothetical protein E2C01_015073 [Portunus trituberculatus]|uniref:Uncharacterized protein n=1 Tax=Portunus trituberculatus TaxID=210409 RepID=A0A5B7DLR2_PORTR|nr:hypothetical protein [Portunus trituberculatus]
MSVSHHPESYLLSNSHSTLSNMPLLNRPQIHIAFPQTTSPVKQAITFKKCSLRSQIAYHILFNAISTPLLASRNGLEHHHNVNPT